MKSIISATVMARHATEMTNVTLAIRQVASTLLSNWVLKVNFILWGNVVPLHHLFTALQWVYRNAKEPQYRSLMQLRNDMKCCCTNLSNSINHLCCLIQEARQHQHDRSSYRNASPGSGINLVELINWIFWPDMFVKYTATSTGVVGIGEGILSHEEFADISWFFSSQKRKSLSSISYISIFSNTSWTGP